MGPSVAWRAFRFVEHRTLIVPAAPRRAMQAVTAPVSRTFEAGFDFIFFDWDMCVLSLSPSPSLPLILCE